MGSAWTGRIIQRDAFCIGVIYYIGTFTRRGANIDFPEQYVKLVCKSFHGKLNHVNCIIKYGEQGFEIGSIFLENIRVVCENCNCGGQHYVDYKLLGYGIKSASECFDIAQHDSFCGTMVSMESSDGYCSCQGIGKERSCLRQNVDRLPTSLEYWAVYQRNTGITSSQL